MSFQKNWKDIWWTRKRYIHYHDKALFRLLPAQARRKGEAGDYIRLRGKYISVQSHAVFTDLRFIGISKYIERTDRTAWIFGSLSRRYGAPL